MGTIYVMHGVVDGPDRDAFLDRNMIDRSTFANYLDSRTERFTTIERALSGEGDALTIDDAIFACYDAALVARRAGHDVTLFVNPFNIETRSPYWFSLLNLALDRTSRHRATFWGIGYSLDSVATRRQFRKAVKAVICRLPNEDARMAEVRRLIDDLVGDESGLPRSLQPITGAELSELAAAGVRIENHGWTHCHPEAMESAAVWADIAAGRTWLRQHAGVDSRLYAVPFGEVPPPDDAPGELFDLWFMADSRFFAARLGKRIVNRQTLGRKELLP